MTEQEILEKIGFTEKDFTHIPTVSSTVIYLQRGGDPYDVISALLKINVNNQNQKMEMMKTLMQHPVTIFTNKISDA